MDILRDVSTLVRPMRLLLLKLSRLRRLDSHVFFAVENLLSKEKLALLTTI